MHGGGGDGIEQRKMFGFHVCEPSPCAPAVKYLTRAPVRTAAAGQPARGRAAALRMGVYAAVLPAALLCARCAGAAFGPREAAAHGPWCARAGHSFDAAKQGYFNFLVGKGTVFEADAADMVAARFDFLSAGHYQPLADASRPAPCLPPARCLDAGTTGHYPGPCWTRPPAPATTSGPLPGRFPRAGRRPRTFPSSHCAAPRRMNPEA